MTATIHSAHEPSRWQKLVPPGLITGIASALLAIPAAPAHADDTPGLTGPAAGYVQHMLTDGELIRCYDRAGHDINCQMKLHSVWPHLFYGDANGHGPNSDVLAITFYNNDPTGDAQMLSVAYFRRDGGRYRYVRSFPKVFMGDIAPGTSVVFRDGHVSFTGLTLRPQDDYHNPQGRTRYVLDLR
ncbi:hypothetical protein FHR90_001852 [Endobacter medicaginis]|uniref:Uncharacterized protein n=1 Tax=Endobacter medicaginis TaxID=1181271 RepID=A0A850NZD6_9PROT|nr:hypothetical protein [Endobacter medicaginis]MBB3174020.1 hypothetical protein [Endobacter medicaginis]MCX5475123.1 hypothetical protein [Endobacter medicaginis]NVN32078.1 hypothetical protein [Endobacter medicaginis]